jgi:Caspase domain
MGRSLPTCRLNLKCLPHQTDAGPRRFVTSAHRRDSVRLPSSRQLCTRKRRAIAALAISVVVGSLLPAHAGSRFLLTGDGRPVHGLVIGIDAYQHVRPLKGASADARDIESVLRKMGVKDLVALLDAQADRASVLREVNAMLPRVGPGDLIVLSIAGHGAQEPERVKGSQPDGMDDVFLLPGFEINAAGSQQRIMGSEFNHIIKEFESRGARVLFVADVCHGGGMAREVDPRAAELSFREVPRYTLSVDKLVPISTPADARMTKVDFHNTTFLAAVDRSAKAPEVRIPGIAGFRGALSYAVARAFEGEADVNGDGKVTVEELFEQVRAVVYQLSDQRQTPVTFAPPDHDIRQDVAFALTEEGRQPAIAAATSDLGTRSKITITSVDTEVPQSVSNPIRISSLDPKVDLSGLQERESAFRVSHSSSDTDLVWDPKSGDVLSGGDVVAYHVEKSELPNVIDRTAAVQRLKKLLSRSPQKMNVQPDDAIHHEHSKVVVDVASVEGRALILFNLASDGTVQALYPHGSDSAFLSEAKYRLPLVVRSPFGADQVVAITSAQRMLALEQVLNEFDGRRGAAGLIKLLERYAPKDARFGSVGIFTAR